MDFSWSDWHFHPSIILGVFLLAGTYLVAVRKLRYLYQRDERNGVRQGLFFGLGVLILFLDLQSPLHDLGDQYLFSAHMVQHMLLILVVAPLLLLGTPGWLIRPLLQVRWVASAAHICTNPVTALALFYVSLLLWHLPSSYELALQVQEVHILEHVVFLGTAILMWWPVLSPLPELPRLSPPAQMLYLFVLSLLPAVLGAFITFSGAILYQTYAEAPRVWGISPLVDQQIGGLIMKIPGTLVFWGVLTWVFFSWASQESNTGELRDGWG